MKKKQEFNQHFFFFFVGIGTEGMHSAPDYTGNKIYSFQPKKEDKIADILQMQASFYGLGPDLKH